MAWTLPEDNDLEQGHEASAANHETVVGDPMAKWMKRVKHVPCLTGGMSWKRAQEDAQNWLDGLHLSKDLRGSGRLVDLREAAKSIPGGHGHRIMVLRAAARLLKERQINALLPETK